MEVIRRGAADIANVYVTEAGGLLNASRIFALCEAAGMPCMIGSMPEFDSFAVVELATSLEQQFGSAHLLQSPVGQHGHTVPERQRLHGVVGNMDHCRRKVAPEQVQLPA